MRIAIISDVHANLAALESIQEPYDVLLCLGDLVDYGPQPHEAIHWVKERALRVIRGNHDHALGYDVDCHLKDQEEKYVIGRLPRSRILKTVRRGRPLSGLPARIPPKE